MTATYSAHAVIAKVSRYVERRTPCMLWGAPGIGKSDMVAQVAEARGLQLVDIRLPLMESVDLRGLPAVIDGVTRFMPPEEMQRATQRPSLIIWDEINSAPMSVQVASYQAILNNRIGEFDFGPETRHVCAGNRLSDKAGAQMMSSALMNRMAHIDVEADAKAWIAWAAENSISPLLMGFMNYRAELLHKPVTGAREFPSPRTWAMASRFLDLPKHERQDMVAGLVGGPAAIEFEAFAQLVGELDTPAVICADPDRARLPSAENIGGAYGVTAALAYFVDSKTAQAGAHYIKRLPMEFHALFATLLTARDSKIASKAFASVAVASGARMV